MIRFFFIAFAMMAGTATAQDDFLYHLEFASGKLKHINREDRFRVGEGVTLFVGSYYGKPYDQLPAIIDTVREGVLFAGSVKFERQSVRGRSLLVHQHHADAVPGTHNFFMIKAENGKAVCLFNPYRPVDMSDLSGWTWQDARPCQ